MLNLWACNVFIICIHLWSSEPNEEQREVDIGILSLTHKVTFSVDNKGPSAVSGLLLQIGVPKTFHAVNILYVSSKVYTWKTKFFFCILLPIRFQWNQCFFKFLRQVLHKSFQVNVPFNRTRGNLGLNICLSYYVFKKVGLWKLISHVLPFKKYYSKL